VGSLPTRNSGDTNNLFFKNIFTPPPTPASDLWIAVKVLQQKEEAGFNHCRSGMDLDLALTHRAFLKSIAVHRFRTGANRLNVPEMINSSDPLKITLFGI